VCNSGHRIETANVIVLVRDTLKGIAEYAKTDKEAFKKSVLELLASQQTNKEIAALQTTVERYENGSERAKASSSLWNATLTLPRSP